MPAPPGPPTSPAGWGCPKDFDLIKLEQVAQRPLSLRPGTSASSLCVRFRHVSLMVLFMVVQGLHATGAFSSWRSRGCSLGVSFSRGGSSCWGAQALVPTDLSTSAPGSGPGPVAMMHALSCSATCGLPRPGWNPRPCFGRKALRRILSSSFPALLSAERGLGARSPQPQCWLCHQKLWGL